MLGWKTPRLSGRSSIESGHWLWLLWTDRFSPFEQIERSIKHGIFFKVYLQKWLVNSKSTKTIADQLVNALNIINIYIFDHICYIYVVPKNLRPIKPNAKALISALWQRGMEYAPELCAENDATGAILVQSFRLCWVSQLGKGTQETWKHILDRQFFFVDLKHFKANDRSPKLCRHQEVRAEQIAEVCSGRKRCSSLRVPNWASIQRPGVWLQAKRCWTSQLVLTGLGHSFMIKTH